MNPAQSKNSTRSEQIEDSLKRLRQRYPSMIETKLRELAALETRSAKKDMHLKELRRDWHERLEQLKIEPAKLLKQLAQQKTEEMKTENHLDLALEILTEEESVVTREQLLQTGLKLSLGQKTNKVTRWSSLPTTKTSPNGPAAACISLTAH